MDYELQIKVKNARLLEVMRYCGYETAAQLSRSSGMSQVTIGKILNLKIALYAKDSNGNPKDVSKPVSDLSEFLGVSPQDIIPPELWVDVLSENQVRYQVSSDQVKDFLEGKKSYSLDDFEKKTDHALLVKKALSILTPREKEVIEKRMEGISFKKIGLEDRNQVTPERVRQMEAKAMRKIRRAFAAEGITEQELVD